MNVNVEEMRQMLRDHHRELTGNDDLDVSYVDDQFVSDFAQSLDANVYYNNNDNNKDSGPFITYGHNLRKAAERIGRNRIRLWWLYRGGAKPHGPFSPERACEKGKWSSKVSDVDEIIEIGGRCGRRKKYKLVHNF